MIARRVGAVIAGRVGGVTARRVCGVIAALPLAAGLAGCGGSSPPPAAHGGLDVVASTSVWAEVVREVAGDRVRVTALVADPAADPHSYQATAQDAARVAGADLVVANGGGYDAFLDQMLAAARVPPQRVVQAFALRADKGDDNEHVWYDPATVRAVADAVAARLGELDPAARDALRAGAVRLGSTVDEIAGRLAALRAAHRGARVAVTEPVAHYLIRAAGLTDVTPEQFVAAEEAGNDPPAAVVVAVQDLLRRRVVDALVVNPQTQTPVTRAVAQQAVAAGVPVVEVSETLPPGMDYGRWVDGEVTALGQALDRGGTP